VSEQMRLAHVYQNKLIELERARRAEWAAVLAQVPEVGVLNSRIASLEAQLESERAELGRMRSEARDKSAGDPTRAKNIVVELKTLRKERKAAIKAALTRQEVIEGTARVAAKHKEETKAARAVCGVYWGSYCQVERAAEQAAKSPVEPVFQRWTGDGGVTVQVVTNGNSANQSIAKVLDGTNNYVRISNVALPVPGRGREGSRPLPRLMLRIGSTEDREPIFAEWPIVLHRPFPESALVKFASVLRRRIGSREVWSAHFTVELPAQQIREGTSLAVNLRWSKTTQGGELTTLAADWSSDGAFGEIHVEPEVVSQLRKAEDLQSIRDKNFERAKARLSEMLKALELPDALREKLEHFHAWKAQGKLAAVVILWREHRFSGDAEAFAFAEAWRKQDKHLWDWEANARRKALARRKDSYRVFAAKMARLHTTLIIEKLDLARLAQEPQAEEDRDYNIAASAQRVATAPSELRSALLNAFRREGGTVIEVAAGLTSREMLAASRSEGSSKVEKKSGPSARTLRLHKNRNGKNSGDAAASN
jgi:hypothetical protein